MQICLYDSRDLDSRLATGIVNYHFPDTTDLVDTATREIVPDSALLMALLSQFGDDTKEYGSSLWLLNANVSPAFAYVLHGMVEDGAIRCRYWYSNKESHILARHYIPQYGLKYLPDYTLWSRLLDIWCEDIDLTQSEGLLKSVCAVTSISHIICKQFYLDEPYPEIVRVIMRDWLSQGRCERSARLCKALAALPIERSFAWIKAALYSPSNSFFENILSAADAAGELSNDNPNSTSKELLGSGESQSANKS